MSNGAAIGMAVGLVLVLGAGIAALGGLSDNILSRPNVQLHLAGGGGIAPSVRAVVRRTGADGISDALILVPAPLADGTLALALPESSAGKLTDIALIDGAQRLWQVSPQPLRLVAPAEGADPPALLQLVAEPEALRPFLHGPFSCTMALADQSVTLTRTLDGAEIVLSVNTRVFSLRRNGAGWTDAASGTTFTPQADGSALVSLPGGNQARCTPDLPAGLLPLDLAGDGWRLQVDSTSVVLLRTGDAPLVLPASGTVSQITGDRLEALQFRTSGAAAPQIIATYATCSDDATGDRRSWRVTVNLVDGTTLQACAGDPLRAEDGDWKLVSLNLVGREYGGSFTLSARAFVAESYCHRHEGRVIREDGTIRLQRERRVDLGECPKRGLAMAEALDAAMASGMDVRPDKQGGLALVGIGDDLKDGVYIRAKRDGGS